MALMYTPPGELGSTCPNFDLPGTDGNHYSREDFSGKSAFLLMVICNHCPYVKAIENRLVKLGEYFKNKDVAIAAISANDAEKYPEDSFEKMKEKKYPFPYLYDSTQAVARNLGAVCTPDFFLYDSDMKLVYRGRLDDSWKDASQVTKLELKEAIDLLLEGRIPANQQYPSMGCSIKWKENNL